MFLVLVIITKITRIHFSSPSFPFLQYFVVLAVKDVIDRSLLADDDAIALLIKKNNK